MFLECIGYHGTSMKAAEQIQKNGYQASSEKEWLGKGIYFFGTSSGSIESDGCEEAVAWVCNVKKFNNWVIFEANINSTKFLDLVKNINHRKRFDIAKNKIIERYARLGKSNTALRDYIIFKCIDEESDFDFIRALIDAGRQQYQSAVVRRPQIQICVKKEVCIKTNNIIRKG